MWEIILVIMAVLGAAIWMGYTLYRRATGKSGCAGCTGCVLTPKPPAKAFDTRPADNKKLSSPGDK